MEYQVICSLNPHLCAMVIKKTGVIGTTLKPETTKVWALSRHVCGKLLQDLSEIRGNRGEAAQVELKNKEEAKARIENDKIDREGIRQKLKECIHPLDPSYILMN